ncbi:unnamed protein product [Allacma fusca]|uniref:Uncharacterized protein n=1 Tax=Allacma fusca TaxID=39272 RepID=A0A8J2NX62_9HEXA|nr:unnamed protein product [Allacma fusca]
MKGSKKFVVSSSSSESTGKKEIHVTRDFNCYKALHFMTSTDESKLIRVLPQSPIKANTVYVVDTSDSTNAWWLDDERFDFVEVKTSYLPGKSKDKILKARVFKLRDLSEKVDLQKTVYGDLMPDDDKSDNLNKWKLKRAVIHYSGTFDPMSARHRKMHENEGQRRKTRLQKLQCNTEQQTGNRFTSVLTAKPAIIGMSTSKSEISVPFAVVYHEEREKSIRAAIKNELPKAHHAFCINHMRKNIRQWLNKRFSKMDSRKYNKDVKKLVWAETTEGYEKCLNQFCPNDYRNNHNTTNAADEYEEYDRILEDETDDD